MKSSKKPKAKTAKAPAAKGRAKAMDNEREEPQQKPQQQAGEGASQGEDPQPGPTGPPPGEAAPERQGPFVPDRGSMLLLAALIYTKAGHPMTLKDAYEQAKNLVEILNQDQEKVAGLSR